MADSKKVTISHRAIVLVALLYLGFGQFDIQGSVSSLKKLPVMVQILEEHTTELKLLRDDINFIKEVLRRNKLAGTDQKDISTAVYN